MMLSSNLSVSSWIKVLTRQELVHFGALGAPRSPYVNINLEQNSKIVKVFLCFFLEWFGGLYRSRFSNA